MSKLYPVGASMIVICATLWIFGGGLGSYDAEAQRAFEVIKGAYDAANRRDYGYAQSCLGKVDFVNPAVTMSKITGGSPDLESKIIRSWWDAVTRDGQIAEITFDKAKLNGKHNVGVVLFHIRYQDGSSRRAGHTVAKRGARWLISWTDADLDYERVYELYKGN